MYPELPFASSRFAGLWLFHCAKEELAPPLVDSSVFDGTVSLTFVRYSSRVKLKVVLDKKFTKIQFILIHTIPKY
jgi:hypothetical protein